MGLGKAFRAIFTGTKNGNDSGNLKGEITNDDGTKYAFEGTYKEIPREQAEQRFRQTPTRQDGCNPDIMLDAIEKAAKW